MYLENFKKELHSGITSDLFVLFFSRLFIPADNVQLDNYYASLVATANTGNDNDVSFSDSDRDEDIVDATQNQPASVSAQDKDIAEILGDLAKEISNECISKFNISRNFLWEGTRRALSRKSFSPANKVSVKFTDDSGVSEGAVDLGGPMREFFTLCLQYLHNSLLFCGLENHKFLSFQSRCLEDDDYFIAGTIIAMSIVHGGPAPQFLSPLMFDALVNDMSKVVVSVQDVYDAELQSSLQALLNSATLEEALRLMNEGNLPTILDLAGTLQPVRQVDDIARIVASTTHWFVLGRAQPALESFQKGLASLGVLAAMRAYPDSFRQLFCHCSEVLTADKMERLFSVKSSLAGSTKAVIESLVLSRWSDYLQDIEEGEDSINLSDILFFATGCKSLPPRNISPSIEFLHEPGRFGQSRFPTANTCSATLRLPVIHESYDSFKADISFGIQNGRGFGTA